MGTVLFCLRGTKQVFSLKLRLLTCPYCEQRCWLLLPGEKSPGLAEEGSRIFPPLTPHWDHDWRLPLMMLSCAPEALPRGQ